MKKSGELKERCSDVKSCRWSRRQQGIQIGFLVMPKRGTGMSGILITFHEVIRVFRTWMGGDELPLGGGFCRFRSKPRCQIFFQNGVIFRAPANRPFFGFPMPFPVKLPVLSGIAENLRQSGVKFRLRKILQSKNLLKHFRRKIQFVDMNLKNHRKTRRNFRHSVIRRPPPPAARFGDRGTH